jgi:hypothetical protein
MTPAESESFAVRTVRAFAHMLDIAKIQLGAAAEAAGEGDLARAADELRNAALAARQVSDGAELLAGSLDEQRARP